jgi:hypothetical protein
VHAVDPSTVVSHWGAITLGAFISRLACDPAMRAIVGRVGLDRAADEIKSGVHGSLLQNVLHGLAAGICNSLIFAVPSRAYAATWKGPRRGAGRA